MRRTAAVLAVLVALAACGSDDDDASGTVAPVTTANDDGASTPPTTVPPTSPTSPATVPPTDVLRTDPTPAGSIPAALPPGGTDLERAIADVVRRTGADPTEVIVVADEAVTWRDAGIGCPQKGMQYLQVLTDGTRIVLELDGRRFNYHAGGRRDLFYCATPQPPVGE
jgi:hypothetical protein